MFSVFKNRRKKATEIWNPAASCFSAIEYSEMKHSGSKVSRIILNIGTNSTENTENQALKAGFYHANPMF